MKEKIKEIGYVLQDFLRMLIGEITPEKKLVFILSILLIGTLANLYMTFKAVQSIGKKNSNDSTFEIRHIEQPQIVNRDMPLPQDSLKGGNDEND